MKANGSSMLKCDECASPLAHDQRYCLSCGARRGSLPGYVAALIGTALERGHRLVIPRAEEAESEAGPFDAWLAAPRAAAVAVMGMLGFGVIVGSLVSESAASSPQTVVAVAPGHGQRTPSALGTAANSGGGGASGAAGGAKTITVVSPAPPQSAAAASAAPVAAPVASPTTTAATTPLGGTLPPVKHVFLIMLSDQGYNQTFVNSVGDPYLARTLVKQGELIPNYYSVAGGSLANEIALISGQGPTPDTVNNCPVYSNLTPGDYAAQGQILGSGCVYPTYTPSLPAQLTEAHLTWKAYVETKASGSGAPPGACRHPRVGSPDAPPTASDPYATWRNPFLYFHSLIDTRSCSKNDVGVSRLARDLRAKRTTAALSYIVADVCHDGSDTPCAPGAASGMAAAEPFLKQVVKEIKRSAAYKADGLIAITFDNAPQTGPNADSSSCCDNPTYPNLPSSPTTAPGSPTGSSGTTGTTGTTAPSGSSGTTGTTGTTAPTGSGGGLGGQTNPTGGGGQVGLLVISRYVKPGNLDVTDFFNHFSLLASIEKLFGLTRLGYAQDPLLPVFGPAVFTNYSG